MPPDLKAFSDKGAASWQRSWRQITLSEHGSFKPDGTISQRPWWFFSPFGGQKMLSADSGMLNAETGMLAAGS
jgi:hypothetical protein